MKMNDFRTKLHASPIYDILLLAQVLIVNWIVYLGARTIAGNLPHYTFVTPIDEAIPFLPWTMLIYWGGAAYWAVNYFLGAHNRIDGHSHMVMAHVIGEAICFVILILLPTTMTRPEITGNTFFDRILRLNYRLDNPDNLLPSIHCFDSWLCWIEARRNPRVPSWYRAFSLIMAIAICVSTLTVKQHVLVDVPAGILVAEAGFFCADRVIRRMRKA